MTAMRQAPTQKELEEVLNQATKPNIMSEVVIARIKKAPTLLEAYDDAGWNFVENPDKSWQAQTLLNFGARLGSASCSLALAFRLGKDHRSQPEDVIFHLYSAWENLEYSDAHLKSTYRHRIQIHLDEEYLRARKEKHAAYALVKIHLFHFYKKADQHDLAEAKRFFNTINESELKNPDDKLRHDFLHKELECANQLTKLSHDSIEFAGKLAEIEKTLSAQRKGRPFVATQILCMTAYHYSRTDKSSYLLRAGDILSEIYKSNQSLFAIRELIRLQNIIVHKRDLSTIRKHINEHLLLTLKSCADHNNPLHFALLANALKSILNTNALWKCSNFFETFFKTLSEIAQHPSAQNPDIRSNLISIVEQLSEKALSLDEHFYLDTGLFKLCKLLGMHEKQVIHSARVVTNDQTPKSSTKETTLAFIESLRDAGDFYFRKGDSQTAKAYYEMLSTYDALGYVQRAKTIRHNELSHHKQAAVKWLCAGYRSILNPSSNQRAFNAALQSTSAQHESKLETKESDSIRKKDREFYLLKEFLDEARELLLQLSVSTDRELRAELVEQTICFIATYSETFKPNGEIIALFYDFAIQHHFIALANQLKNTPTLKIHQNETDNLEELTKRKEGLLPIINGLQKNPSSLSPYMKALDSWIQNNPAKNFFPISSKEIRIFFMTPIEDHDKNTQSPESRVRTKIMNSWKTSESIYGPCLALFLSEEQEEFSKDKANILQQEQDQLLATITTKMRTLSDEEKAELKDKLKHQIPKEQTVDDFFAKRIVNRIRRADSTPPSAATSASFTRVLARENTAARAAAATVLLARRDSAADYKR